MSLTFVSQSCVSQEVDTVNYPAGLSVGDAVLLAIRGSANTGQTQESYISDSFTRVVSVTETNGSASTVFVRIIDGTEGASFTITQGGVRLHISVFSVTGITGVIGDVVSGQAVGLDPPSVAAPSGADNVLWFAGATWQSDTVQVSGYPTGYTNTAQVRCDATVSTKPVLAYGTKTSNFTSENPDAFTTDGAAPDPASFTIGFALADPTRWGFTITDIKEPNESDTLVTGVSNARVLVWLSGDNATAASHELTNQSITGGSMTVELPSGDETDTPKVHVEWDAGGGETKYFLATPTIIDLDA